MHRYSDFRPGWTLKAAIALVCTLSTHSALAQETAGKTKASVKAAGETAPKREPRTGAPSAEAEAKAPKEATGSEEGEQGEAKETSDTAAESPEAGADGKKAEPAGPTPEQREEARVAFEAGTTAFAEEKYSDAALSFQKAQGIVPSPHAEYWIARSLDKADTEGEDRAAVAKAYRTFLTNPGAKHVGADEVSQAQERYEELRHALPATVTITSDPAGASVTLDGEAREGVTPYTFEAEEGTYQVGLSLEGYEDTTVEVQAEGGIELEQEVTLMLPPPPPEEPVAPSEPAEEKPRKSMVPAIVTLGLGGAGLISGTVFGIMALNSKSKFKDAPTTDNADAAERNALIADMSFGIALTLGITGVVLLTAGGDEGDETAKAKKTEFAFAPYASPRGGGAAARWTF